MLNVFTKTKPWLVASLVAASSVFAQSNKDNCRTPKAPDPMPAPTMAAYNAPSRIDVRGAWDIYADASFIYWQPLQDNMEYAIATTGTSTMFGTTSAPVSNTVQNLNPNYKPGFQVGLGMNFDYDNWDSYLHYTWFHNTNTNSSSGTILPTFGHPAGTTMATGSGTMFESASANWHLKMDLLDWQLARAYYVGTKLTFRPYFGARAAWIREKYNVTYVRTAATAATVVSGNKTTNWGIGPEAGMTANYLFGYGFRMFGDMMGDVLFTRYRVSTTQTNTNGSQTLSIKQSKLNTLRPHANIDLGFGWGSYFDNNNWHVDFAASYCFQAFWDQNMFRRYVDNSMQGDNVNPNGNLYVQGLNVTARLDF